MRIEKYKAAGKTLKMRLAHHPRRDISTLPREHARYDKVPYICQFFPQVKDVLDLGTGRGIFVDECVQAGLNAIGVDLREEIYQADKSRLVIADARQLPFKDESFDLVFAWYIFSDMTCLQELPWSEVEKAIDEAYRVLKKGGIFLTTSYVSPFTLEERFETIAARSTYKKRPAPIQIENPWWAGVR